MAQFDDDDELARLKKWWADNGRGLITGVLLGILIVAGWYGWNWYQDRQARQAAALYEQVNAALARDKLTAGALDAIKRLKNEYTGTPYAVASAMALGRYRVKNGDKGKASTQFAWAVKHAQNAGMRDLARARKARALWHEGQLEKALGVLRSDEPAPGFASLYAEIKGDILLAQGKQQRAHAAYEKALAKRSRYAPKGQLKTKLQLTASTEVPADDHAEADSASTSAS